MTDLAYPVPRLGLEMSRYANLRNQILTEFPDLDDQTLADTLEGVTGLREMLGKVIRSALDDEALQIGLSARLVDMKSRLDRLGERAKRKRDLVRRAMAEADIQKLAAPDFTASLKQSAPALDVLAEDSSQPPTGSRSPASSTSRACSRHSNPAP